MQPRIARREFLSGIGAAAAASIFRLETHWRAGTAEESTHQSWAGVKKELQEAGAL
ncbi:MAG TPA: hypothetical protein VI431_04485 [Candidatus Acidoferrum sp.]